MTGSFWHTRHLTREDIPDFEQKRVKAMLRTTKNEVGCWLWGGCLNRKGYGQITYDDATGHKTTIQLHRFGHLIKGPIPAGMWVLHRCEKYYEPGDITYRRCWNPDHVYRGTAQDNVRDRQTTGRAAIGERAGAHLHPETRPRGDNHPLRRNPELIKHGADVASARLTDDLVRHMKKLDRQGLSTRKIAAIVGVGKSTVWAALSGAQWAHLLVEDATPSPMSDRRGGRPRGSRNTLSSFGH